MSIHMDTSSTTLMANVMVKHEDVVVLLERDLCGDPLAGLLWERQFENVLLGLGGE